MHTYRWSVGDVRMLLVEVFLKFRELVQVPVLFSQSFAGITELSSSTATTSSATTEPGRSTAIAAENKS